MAGTVAFGAAIGPDVGWVIGAVVGVLFAAGGAQIASSERAKGVVKAESECPRCRVPIQILPQSPQDLARVHCTACGSYLSFLGDYAVQASPGSPKADSQAKAWAVIGGVCLFLVLTLCGVYQTYHPSGSGPESRPASSIEPYTYQAGMNDGETDGVTAANSMAPDTPDAALSQAIDDIVNSRRSAISSSRGQAYASGYFVGLRAAAQRRLHERRRR